MTLWPTGRLSEIYRVTDLIAPRVEVDLHLEVGIPSQLLDAPRLVGRPGGRHMRRVEVSGFQRFDKLLNKWGNIGLFFRRGHGEAPPALERPLSIGTNSPRPIFL